MQIVKIYMKKIKIYNNKYNIVVKYNLLKAKIYEEAIKENKYL